MPSLGNVCSNDDSQAWHARAAAALNTLPTSPPVAKRISSFSNNCSRALKVTVDATAAPDLIVYRPSQSAGNLEEEESFTLNATVKNQGTAGSVSSQEMPSPT